MKYRINVGYSIVADAENEDMAIDEALAIISNDPHLHIDLEIKDEKDIPYPPSSFNVSETISFYLDLIQNGMNKEEVKIVLDRITSIKNLNGNYSEFELKIINLTIKQLNSLLNELK